MLIMALFLLTKSRHAYRRSQSRLCLSWIAAATVACRGTDTITKVTAASSAAFLSIPLSRNHLEPFALTDEDWRDATCNTCCSAFTRHTSLLQLPWRQPQQQPVQRIWGRRWLTTRSLSDDANADSSADSPSNRVVRKNKRQVPKEESATTAAVVTPPPKSAEEIAQDAENVEIEKVVRNWLETIVIGLNLCPFAERPVRTNRLHIHIVRGNDEQVLLESMLCALILQNEQPNGGTTLVVCPECHPDDFSEYLNVLSLMETMLEDHDMVGLLQIAPFHPRFEFEGSSSSSGSGSTVAKNDSTDDIEILQNVDNFTNKAPYPIFHILREDEVEDAVEMLQGDAGRVWKRNVRLLESMYQELGAKDFLHVMRPCTAGTTSAFATNPTTQQQSIISGSNRTDINEKVRGILRRHRVRLSKSSTLSSSDGYDDDDDDDNDDDGRPVRT